jgi:hypothetical protein
MNDELTLLQEKNLQKELQLLKDSRPHVLPYQEANDQIKKLRDLLREVQKKINKLFEEKINPAKAEEKTINEQIKKLKEDREKIRKLQQNSDEPAIQAKKEEFNNGIDEIKKQKRAILDAYKENMDAYWKQDRLIYKIGIMKEKKERLVRNERRRLAIEKEIKEEQERIEELRKDPYSIDIQEIEGLIGYLRLFTTKKGEEGKTTENAEQEDGVTEDKEYTDSLYSNTSEVVTKRNRAQFSGIGGQTSMQEEEPRSGKRGRRKRRRNRQNKRQQENKASETMLPMHPQNKVELFEKFKILEPSRFDQVENTIKQLEEKIDYFKNKEPPSEKVLRARLYGEELDEDSPDNDDRVKFSMFLSPIVEEEVVEEGSQAEGILDQSAQRRRRVSFNVIKASSNKGLAIERNYKEACILSVCNFLLVDI